MRLIVTGVKDGQSCVIQEVDCTPAQGAISTTRMLELALAELPPRPVGRSGFVDLGVAPGQMSWLRVNFAPHDHHAFHYTDSIDCHTIVAGAIELLLDDGAHALRPGDSAIVNGVDHGWKAGPEGCTTALMIFGTPKPD